MASIYSALRSAQDNFSVDNTLGGAPEVVRQIFAGYTVKIRLTDKNLMNISKAGEKFKKKEMSADTTVKSLFDKSDVIGKPELLDKLGMKLVNNGFRIAKVLGAVPDTAENIALVITKGEGERQYPQFSIETIEPKPKKKGDKVEDKVEEEAAA